MQRFTTRMNSDGIRVSANKNPTAEKLMNDIHKNIGLVTEEFAPNAFETPAGAKHRPRTTARHRDLLLKELEQSNSQINKLEEALEEQELSNADKIARLTLVVEHQERAIQFRQMHLTTLLDEAVETEEKVKNHENRIKDIRSKALTRKFQSRFWMTLFIMSMIEHIAKGTLMWTMTNVIMPITTDLVFSNTNVAVGMRTLLTVSACVYFRADRALRKIPSLV